MRKKTLVSLVLFVALLGVVQFAGKDKKAEVLPPLKLKGWASELPKVNPTNSPVNVARSGNPEPPYHRIEITKGGQKTILVRDDEDATIWDIIAPIKAPGEVHRVRSMVNILRNDLESLTSFRLRKGNRSKFGLDGSQAIHVRLLAENEAQSVVLVLGTQDRDRVTEDGPGAIRTWIHAPEIQPKAVYLVEGQDFRQPFNLEINKYRSKRLLSVAKWSDIDSLRIQNPGATESQLIHIKRDPQDSEGNKVEAWGFEEPKNFILGSPERIFTSIRGLVAEEIVGRNDVPENTGLENSSQVATIELAVGEARLKLWVGPVVGENFWIQLEGRPDEFYKMPGARRAAILPEISSLREKQMLGIPSPDSLTSIRTSRAGQILISLKRDGESWRREDGAALDPSRSNLLVNTLAKLKAQGFSGGLSGVDAGFDEPSLQVEYAVGTRFSTLSFGKEVDGKVYVRVEPDGEIFQVLSHSMNQLSKGWGELRSRAIVNQAADQIQSVTIQHSDGTQLKIYKGENSQGQKSWIVEPLSEGQNSDGNKINELIRAAATVKVKRFLVRPSSVETGLGSSDRVSTVTLNFTGSEKIVLTVSNRSDSDARFVRIQGGPMAAQTVTVSSASVDRILRKPTDLISAP